jgi:hypothetical protein
LETLGEKNLRDIIGYLTANKPKGYQALDLAGAFTADSRRGLYAAAGDQPSLAFKQYGIVMVDNIPFNIANPATTPGGRNVIVLKGGSGFAKTLPQRVEFKAGLRAAKLYVLGGVAGWGFPDGDPDGYNVPACKATLHYADGQTEEVIWKNGEEFADYVRPYEVPGSKAVPELVTTDNCAGSASCRSGMRKSPRSSWKVTTTQRRPHLVAMTAISGVIRSRTQTRGERVRGQPE